MLKEELTKALKENALVFDETAIQKLLHYLNLLTTWNKVFNLTAITDPKEMIYLHLIDSLAVAPYLVGKRCLDVGSGAGLPGIPLAIIDPSKSWILLDKNSKKTRFMTQAIAELGLTQVSIFHGRAQDFHPALGFDSILSRAFASLPVFLESTEHLLAPEGMFIAMKGKYPEAELTEIPERFLLGDITRLDIKGTDIERHLVRVRKR